MQSRCVEPIGRSLRLLHIRNIAVAIVAASVATRAAAATFDLSAYAMSDYRYRGISLSDRQPVVDGSVAASTGSWFAGVEALSASRLRTPDRPTRRSAEIDVSAGWSRAIGVVTPTAGAIVYTYPGGGPAIGEGFATLAGALGPATLTVGANYAPDQTAARGGNLYLFTRAAAGLPGTPLTLHASVGRERGALAGGATKIDYAGGVEARVLRVVTLGVDYVGNDRATTGPGRLARNREDGFVLRAGVRF